MMGNATSSGFLTTGNKYLLGAAMGAVVVTVGVAGLIIWILSNRSGKHKGRRRPRVGDPDPVKVERSSDETTTDVQNLLKEEKEEHKPKTCGRKKYGGDKKTKNGKSLIQQNNKENLSHSGKNSIKIRKSDSSFSEKDEIRTIIHRITKANEEIKDQNVSDHSLISTTEVQSNYTEDSDETDIDSSIVCEEPEVHVPLFDATDETPSDVLSNEWTGEERKSYTGEVERKSYTGEEERKSYTGEEERKSCTDKKTIQETQKSSSLAVQTTQGGATQKTQTQKTVYNLDSPL